MNWKRSFNFGQGQFVGLDIGSSAVKVVLLHRDNGGYAVMAAGIVQIEPNPRVFLSEDSSGDNCADANTTNAISQCLQSAGVVTKLAVCSVCGPEVAVRDFKFPSLPREELEGAIILEAAQICPFDTADSVIDYQVMTEGDGSTRGVLVATRNALIKKKLQLAKKASIDCVLMDVDGLALLNCLNEYAPRQSGYAAAILNVGRSYTTLAINGDNELPFIRDIACAGDYIIKQIAAQTGQTAETVSAILSGPGLTAENAETNNTKGVFSAVSALSAVKKFDFRDNLEKACERLIVDVNETLRFYAAKEKSSIAERIFVCGGFALVEGFIEILNRHLAAKAVLWNPFTENSKFEIRNSKFISTDILQKHGPAMAVAAGLAMRSI